MSKIAEEQKLHAWKLALLQYFHGYVWILPKFAKFNSKDNNHELNIYTDMYIDGIFILLYWELHPTQIMGSKIVKCIFVSFF